MSKKWEYYNNFYPILENGELDMDYDYPTSEMFATKKEAMEAMEWEKENNSYENYYLGNYKGHCIYVLNSITYNSQKQKDYDYTLHGHKCVCEKEQNE